MGRVSSKRRPTGSTAGPLKYPSQNRYGRLSRGAVSLNNLNIHNPDTDSCYAQPEDPNGFIYRTYSAAERQNQKYKPFIKRSNQVEAYVSSAIGGSLSQISFRDSEGRNRIAPTHCGGIKGRVRGFSRVSRRNLLRKFASINRTAFRAYKGRMFSLTLTYPHAYPEDPEICKRHLKALHKRIKRRFGDFAGFWRMGYRSEEPGTSTFSYSCLLPSGYWLTCATSYRPPGTRFAEKSPRGTSLQELRLRR